MYYYIFEPSSNYLQRRLKEQVRRKVGALGISGEIASPNPARTIEELIKQAFTKKYRTIVAVGSDHFINKVASMLVGTNAVFGAIPLNKKSEIANLIKVENINEAVLALRQRKITPFSLGEIVPAKYFLTKALIQNPRSLTFKITVDDFALKAQISDLIIQRNNKLQLTFWNKEKAPSPLLKIFFWLFALKPKIPETTTLSGGEIILEATNNIGIYVEDEMLSRLPCKLRIVPQALQLITLRGKL